MKKGTEEEEEKEDGGSGGGGGDLYLAIGDRRSMGANFGSMDSAGNLSYSPKVQNIKGLRFPKKDLSSSSSNEKRDSPLKSTKIAPFFLRYGSFQQ